MGTRSLETNASIRPRGPLAIVRLAACGNRALRRRLDHETRCGLMDRTARFGS